MKGVRCGAYGGAHPDAGDARGVQGLVAGVLPASDLFKHPSDALPRSVLVICWIL